MDYKETYEEGKRALVQAGIMEAGLDARLLLEYICHTDRSVLLAHPDREVVDSEYAAYRECIERRSVHEPLQHITGVQEFMGLEFYVNDKVLIPRQDTEILVEEVLRQLHDGMSVLDMCTGSGCILLSLLHYTNGCKGTGADISGEALEVAKKNAEALDLSPVFIQSDLFDGVSGRFDRIVSNPPYIETGVIAGLMEEVKDFEPMLALDGREDGLYYYRRIVREAREHLNGGGYLFFEIGHTQAEAVSNIMRKAGYLGVTSVKDFAGLDRVVYGMLEQIGEKNV